MKWICFFIAMVIGISAVASAQQVADSSFNPSIANPTFGTGQGPIVMLDEAHHNFHTVDGRYYPFAKLLRRDGYQVISSTCPFTVDSLKRGAILVIANALNERNIEEWSLPTPSAFTDSEISAVRQWVSDGGSLFLIADHMPFGGAAENLARAFGFSMNNGFATSDSTAQGGGDVFRRVDNTLADHPITRGRTDRERIDSVRSFTGQAFEADSASVGLMIFGPRSIVLMPDTAWQFNDKTPHEPAAGRFQLATKEFGKGRVVMAGEAAMFSAQLSGEERRPAGMNHPLAPQNPQFLLNIMHWLSRLI